MTIEEFKEYKKEYEAKYPLYLALYNQLKQNEDDFRKLGNKLKHIKENDKNMLEKEISYLYTQRKDKVHRMKRKYDCMYEELNSLKKHMDHFVDFWSTHP